MIGDVLTSTVLFELLRKQYPTAALHYLINTNTQAVVVNNPFIDKLHLFDPKKAKQKGYYRGFTQELIAENFDLVIDVYAKLRSARLTRKLRAANSVSYRKWYTKGAYKQTVKPLSHTLKDEGLALVNRVLLLEALGFKDLSIPRPKIYIGETEKNLALAQLRQAELSPEAKVFMIAAFGSSPDKTYPLPYMAKVLDELVARTQASLLFNYLPEQRPQLDELISLCKPSTQSHLRPDIYGKSLREFLALASCCNAVIGNEGGAVNMGKALELPTFSIFSPWILKSAWNSYEASGDNRSVHLADLHPDLYRQHPKKYKKQAASYYAKLDPEFVIESMMTFLDHHDFSVSKP